MSALLTVDDPVTIAILVMVAARISGAALIEWAPDSHDAIAAIEHSTEQFVSRGWDVNLEDRRLERDGWYIWFRSQGVIQPPIAQWGKIR